jgi:hypothetical protein
MPDMSDMADTPDTPNTGVPEVPGVRKTMDFPLRYRGYHGTPSCCRVRVWEQAGKPPVVIATELDDNPGTSVTNRIEVIATMMYQMLERPETGLVIIEHYEERTWAGGRTLLPERFARVEMEWTRNKGFVAPKWTALTKMEVEQFVSGPVGA